MEPAAPARGPDDADPGRHRRHLNFQQHATFWFGMALCESQSYPNPGTACTPDSDTNIKDGANPNSAKWIGNHVGSGFMELQFYPPGWTPLLVGTSCDPTKWCAAVAIFGLSDSLTQTNTPTASTVPARSGRTSRS